MNRRGGDFAGDPADTECLPEPRSATDRLTYWNIAALTPAPKASPERQQFEHTNNSSILSTLPLL